MEAIPHTYFEYVEQAAFNMHPLPDVTQLVIAWLHWLITC